jgi:bacillithiol synthase
MTVEIRVRPLAGPQLVRRYLEGDHDTLSYFAGDPRRLSSFRSQLSRVEARFGTAERQRAAAALRPTSAAAADRLRRFVDEGGAVVVTGQQTGLFTGPLYTVYKALTAVRLAAALERALGTVVLPVFWVASEDHDWAEVNHAYGVDGADRLRRIALDTADPRPLPMHERPLGQGLDNALEDLRDIVGATPFSDTLLRSVRACYGPGRTVASAFRELIAELLSPWDVLTTDAAEPALKEASRNVLAAELTNSDAFEARLRETAERLARAGVSPQVPILPSAPNLFVRTDHGRERLFRAGDGWMTRESGARFTSAELMEIADAEPVRISPNVLLRPVVESSVFPVLAYVGGPGEIAYFAQLREYFDAHGVTMPLVYPRSSMLLLEPAARKLLAELGTDSETLKDDPAVLLRRRSRSLVPEPVRDGLAALRSTLVERFDALAADAAAVDPTLRGMVATRRNRALLGVADAENRIVRAIGRGEGEWRARLDAARAHLAPLGQEQERVANILPILARHGPGVLEQIVAAIEVEWQDADTGGPAAAAGALGR